MSLLDKFNNWYVRAIPETETGDVITWLEPAAGATYRWKANRLGQLLWLPAIFLVIWLVPSRRGYSSIPMETRFWFALIFTAAIGLLGWLYRGTRQAITLSTQRVIIGQGRGQRRIHLDEAHPTLEQRDGHTVLIVRMPSKDPERIYLDPEKEGEIREFLTKAGWLKS